jgi:hypothetical protein
MSAEIKWPKGKSISIFRGNVKQYAETIVKGRVLAIDPSSASGESKPGYAVFEAGEMTESGIIAVNHKQPVQKRLREISECLREEFEPCDILAIEKLRGHTCPPPLWWSVGSVQSSVTVEASIEVPITWWKAWSKVKADYKKSDRDDAIVIGESLIMLAKEYCK